MVEGDGLGRFVFAVGTVDVLVARGVGAWVESAGDGVVEEAGDAGEGVDDGLVAEALPAQGVFPVEDAAGCDGGEVLGGGLCDELAACGPVGGGGGGRAGVQPVIKVLVKVLHGDFPFYF